MERGLRLAVASLAATGLLPSLRMRLRPRDNAPVAARDDTGWRQSKPDAGGKVVLKKLSGGACYQT